jgi:hypothetical protein
MHTLGLRPLGTQPQQFSGLLLASIISCKTVGSSKPSTKLLPTIRDIFIFFFSLSFAGLSALLATVEYTPAQR